MIAESLKKNVEWVDLASVAQGVRDYMAGIKLNVKINSVKRQHDFYHMTFELFKKESQANFHQAIAFLKSRAANPSAHSLEDGKIIYEVIAEGDRISIVQRVVAPPCCITLFPLPMDCKSLIY